MPDDQTQLRLPGLESHGEQERGIELTVDAVPASIGHTKISSVKTREILTRSTGFMEDYDYTLNPYSGCFFGCTYCYAAFFSRNAERRDTWGSWVSVKENAVEALDKQIRTSIDTLDGKRIYMSSVTDPYQPVERQLKLTRNLLALMAEGHKPKVVVQTRSPDVVRDIDLFKAIEDNGGRIQVNMTVTTDDEDVRRSFEPNCPANTARLSAIKEIQESGIQSCITMTPLLIVSSPYAFLDHLLDTGVKRFIIQPFHFNQGKFIANTGPRAIEILARKLECDVAAYKTEYLAHYQDVFDILSVEMGRRGLQLGEGKEGFKPPF